MKYSIILISLIALALFIYPASIQSQTTDTQTCVASDFEQRINVFNYFDYQNHPSWQKGMFILPNVQENVSIPDHPDLNFSNLDFSFTVRFLADINGTGTQVIFDKRYENETVQGIVLFIYNGYLGFQLADGLSQDADYSASFSNYVSNIEVVDGQWHVVTITVNRDEVGGGKLYVDGILEYEFNPQNHVGSLDSETSLFLGRRSSSNTGYFVGQISSLSFLPCLLTAEQIENERQSSILLHLYYRAEWYLQQMLFNLSLNLP